MIYILKSEKSINHQPEINYGGGVSMPFKIGYFLFDTTEKTDKSFWVNTDAHYIDLDSERFYFEDNLSFNNKIRAEIVFYRLKLDEMEKNSMNYFLPNKYVKIKERFKELVAQYPEYTI